MRIRCMCEVCGEPLIDHPDDFPCPPAKVYPPLPEGCTLEPGRRQLAVGELRKPGTDRLLAFSGTKGWIWISEPNIVGEIRVCRDVVTRAEEPK